jgi:prepilin-type N-terminal cleavage/methylation domain-containing protein
MTWLRRRLPALRREHGVTLVELVVVLSILGLILGFVTRGFISMQSASISESYRLQNLDEARTLMDVVARDLRTATRMSASTSPFDVVAGSVPTPGFGNNPPYAGASEVWFYANLTLTTASPNPCPDVVHLYVDTAVSPPVLKEQTISADAGGTPPSCTYTGSYTTRLVGKYVANPSNEPVFIYFYDDSSGNPTAFASTSVPLVASDRLLVNQVGVTLAIRLANNYQVPYTTLVNRVRLPNVDYNPLPTPSP